MILDQAPKIENGNILYHTRLPRWIAVASSDSRLMTSSLGKSFRDERRKITTAKWKFRYGWHISYEPHMYLFRLDGRSVRYMRRVEIVDCCLLWRKS